MKGDSKRNEIIQLYRKKQFEMKFKSQCTTQRVYSKRDLFKTLTSMNIARDHHNRIIYRFIEL